MNGEVLLDTNIVIALFEGDRRAEAGLLSTAGYYATSITLGELYFGAERSARREANLSRIDHFVKASRILVPDTESARHYGIIRNALRMKGRPIPDHDIWVAAIAIQHGLSLITRDAHFRDVEGLAIASWLDK